MNTSLFDQVRQLSVEEQIELVEALWDDIVERNAVPACPVVFRGSLRRLYSRLLNNVLSLPFGLTYSFRAAIQLTSTGDPLPAAA